MEKSNNVFLSLLTLLPEGKVENDVRISERAVTGICTVYVKRIDNENEFLLREIGVAALDGGNLTDAVRTAVGEAYEAAIKHIAGIMPTAQTTGETKKTRAKPIPPPKPKPEAAAPGSSEKNIDATGGEPDTPEADEPVNNPDRGAENNPPSVDLSSIFDESDTGESAMEQTPTPATDNIERIDFAESLFPAADLPTDSDKNEAADTDDDDPAYQKALDMDITIFGKLHDCNGWKAGKILKERPDVIIDFCHRNSENYNGPKYRNNISLLSAASHHINNSHFKLPDKLEFAVPLLGL